VQKQAIRYAGKIREEAMKRIAFVVLVCLVFASVGKAQQTPAGAPASKEDIQRYLEAMHTRDLLKNVMGVMTTQMHKMVHEMLAKQAGVPADFEPRMFRMTDDILKDFPVEEYLQAVTPVYQKHFTKGDVDALVAFYSTPTGQKMIRELPAITAEAMQASSGIMQRIMAKAMERVQDEMAQMQKESDGSAAKNPQTN
jgi:hypothetical protein